MVLEKYSAVPDWVVERRAPLKGGSWRVEGVSGVEEVVLNDWMPEGKTELP